jgi:phage terminase large subunit GpA-like protein
VKYFASSLRVFERPPELPLLLWAMTNVRTIDDRPYDHFESPHLGAPGGPFEAYTDPLVREIYKMWATRLGKTLGLLICGIYTSAVEPAPIFCGSATRDLVEQVIGERGWKMVELSNLFEDVPPEGRRSKRAIRLDRNRWYTGWSESPRTLADKSAKVLLGNEIPKWRHLRGTNEAHPWELAKERTKEYPDRKILGEGSPTVRGRCLIEAAFKTGWGCRLYVPCPKCWRWQTLQFGSGDKGGIVAEGLHAGRVVPNDAQRTAKYACQYCGVELKNDVRPQMMRKGVWVPDGCQVDHDEAAKLFEGLGEFETHHDHPERPYRWGGWGNATWIRGTPLRDGPIASYQLSTIYSLSVGWGDVARKFAEARLRPSLLQNLINSWFAETWEIHNREEEWEVVLRRLLGFSADGKTQVVKPHNRGRVPLGFSLLSCGVDVQSDHFVWSLVAAARPRRWAIVDHGEADSLDWIRDHVLLQPWEHSDGGRPLYVRRCLIDTGFDPADDEANTIHHWARKAQRLAVAKRIPQIVRGCKGASEPLRMPYQERTLGAGTSCPGAKYVLVDGDFTQPIVDRAIYEAEPGTAGSMLLFEAEPHEHEDLVVQLMNEFCDTVLNKKKKEQRIWVRKDETIPNDKRDATRYGIVGNLQEIRGGGEVPVRVTETPEAIERREAEERRRREAPRPGLRMPDGRTFDILSRR